MNTTRSVLVALTLCWLCSALADDIVIPEKIPERYLQFARENQTLEPSESVKQRLIDIETVLKSPAYQAQSKAMDGRVREIMANKVPGFSAENEDDDSSLILDNAAVLFVSESIPMHVLRRYARDLARINGVMVFRGMKGGMHKVGPMVQFIGDITKIDASCRGSSCRVSRVNVIIDPYLFRDNGVQQVPALAFLPRMNINSYCGRDDDAHQMNRSQDLVYGDASVLGMLEAMNGIRKDIRVSAMIRKLEGTAHEES